MHKIEIYGFDGAYTCKFCNNAKRLCETRKLEYVYTPVNDGVDEAGRPVKNERLIETIKERAGAEIKTMPQIFVNDEYIGGFDEFRAYVVKNRIQG